MHKSELRRAKVTIENVSSTDVVHGYFHKWFEKVHEDKTTYLLAVIEDEKGRINLYDADSSDIKIKLSDPRPDLGLE